MSELRWNPILEQWVITATHRQDRTFLPPRDFCPLCPTRPGGAPTEVPSETYQIAVFENKFPGLTPKPAEPAVQGSELYKVDAGQGVCEVILYSPNHDNSLANESVRGIRGLIDVWTDRYEELGSRDYIKYVFIFENKGKEIGVTLTHPHGQIYAYPFIPPKIERELDSSRRFHERTGRCLFCSVMEEERRDGRRMVAENEAFAAFVPFYAGLPYEVHILSKPHRGSLLDFAEPERDDLARLLKVVLLKYDNLWGKSLPYVMVLHQSPTDGLPHDYYHFHIEFYPPYRTKNKLKYLAGSEAGAGTFINDTLAEEKAEELRRAEPSSQF
ncbi:MAG: galactose-1-phosphate uridylyltransferase [Armatimonadota bacterium]|nr:galactose-1-phosphate uridylyltransferase [Armatimonadota bacterium]